MNLLVLCHLKKRYNFRNMILWVVDNVTQCGKRTLLFILKVQRCWGLFRSLIVANCNAYKLKCKKGWCKKTCMSFMKYHNQRSTLFCITFMYLLDIGDSSNKSQICMFILNWPTFMFNFPILSIQNVLHSFFFSHYFEFL